MKNRPTDKELKSFSFIWAFIFFAFTLFGLYHNSVTIYFTIIISLLFLIIAFFKPQIVRGFYKIWVKFGEFMGKIISKLILTIMFFFIFMPVSIVLKILKKDLLNKKIDRKISSYWIERDIQPGSMKNQF